MIEPDEPDSSTIKRALLRKTLDTSPDRLIERSFETKFQSDMKLFPSLFLATINASHTKPTQKPPTQQPQAAQGKEIIFMKLIRYGPLLWAMQNRNTTQKKGILPINRMGLR